MTSVISCILVLIALSSSSLFVSAFTNGTLLPAYICGPTGDGYPKSLGGVLPYFVEATNPTFQTINGILPNRPMDGGSVDNTRLILAGFHNRNVTTAFKKVIGMTIIAQPTPQQATRSPNFVPKNNQIVPGFNHAIQLQSTPNDLGVFDDNTALDGAVVYGMDVANAQRVGKFMATGPNMKVWAACGPNSVGVVHNQLLSDAGHYDGLIWFAPANLKPGNNITFMGAAVTDAGFGAHSTTFTVVAPPLQTPPAPAITKAFLLALKQVTVFFIDPIKGATVAPVTSFTLTATLSQNKAVVATQNVTGKASPLSFLLANFKVGAQVNGVVTVTITATNSVGTSTPSNPLTFTVGTNPTAAPTTAPAATTKPANTTAAAPTTTAAAPTTTAAVPTTTAAPAAAAFNPTVTSQVAVIITNNYQSPYAPTPSSASVATDMASLCDIDYSAQIAAFGMTNSDDADGSCAWQTAFTNQLSAASAGNTVGSAFASMRVAPIVTILAIVSSYLTIRSF